MSLQRSHDSNVTAMAGPQNEVHGPLLPTSRAKGCVSTATGSPFHDIHPVTFRPPVMADPLSVHERQPTHKLLLLVPMPVPLCCQPFPMGYASTLCAADGPIMAWQMEQAFFGGG